MSAARKSVSSVLDDRRRKIAAIHATAAQLGMDTADKSTGSVYRTMLQAQAGVLSTSEASIEGLGRVLAYLQRELDKARGGTGRKMNPQQFIELLWAQLGAAGALRDPTEHGLAQFVHSQVGVASHKWLDGAKSRKVIEALKAWKARAARSNNPEAFK